MVIAAVVLNAVLPSWEIGGIALVHSFPVVRVKMAPLRMGNVVFRYQLAAQFVVGEPEGAPSLNGLLLL